MKQNQSIGVLTRRRFLRQTAVVTTAFAGLKNFFSLNATGAEASSGGKLESDYYGVLDLPPGFSYQVFSEAGEKMNDGLLVPGKHDGMGAIWTGQDGIYFACTNGGTKRKGQIWRYVPSAVEGTPEEMTQPGKLELFLEPNDGNLVENCDNITLAPWGDLIICEDGKSPQYLVGVTPQGKTYRFGKTTLSEFAGACFSPDGKTMFVNILTPGMTVAITGPWAELRREQGV